MFTFEVVQLLDYEPYDDEQLFEAWSLDPLQILLAEEDEY